MKLEWKVFRKILIGIFILYLAIYYWSHFAGFISTLTSAMMPIIIGIIIAYMINILMDMYEDYFFRKSEKKIFAKIRRPVCLIGAILTIIAFIALLIYLVIPELVSSAKILVKSIPNSVETLAKNSLIQKVVPKDMIDKLISMNWKDYIDSMMDFFRGGAGFAGNVMNIAGSVFSIIVSVFLGIIFAIYFLASKERFQKQSLRIIRLIIKEKYYDKTLHYLSVCNQCFHNFIVGKVVDAIIVGLMCGIGMIILGLPYPLMISVFVGFTALIPIVGSYLGIVVGTIIILTVSPTQALIFLVFIILMIQLEANLIYPKLMSDTIGLPGIWVLAAVSVGGTLAGVAGMLVGVPIAASIYRISAEKVREREDELGLEDIPDMENRVQERFTKIKKMKQKAEEKVKEINNKIDN